MHHHWQLAPSICFLNHGSFGATPTVVLQVQRAFQDALERDPIEFLAPERSLEPKLDAVRSRVAETVGARATEIAWVKNATDGVNAVVQSFPFRSGDEVLVTNHGYNACINAARYAAERHGATVRVANVPFPIANTDEVVTAIDRELNNKTRLLLVDHVTSPTGIVFPIEKIVELAHSRGIRVLVDGAHAPGMIPLNLDAIGADYYTANHHKWLCGPKVSGFLWVRPEWQHKVRPTVISHAANRLRPKRSRFIAEFDWQGTFDPSPLLALPTAIDFLETLFAGGLEELMQRNRDLAVESQGVLVDALGIETPAPVDMLGSLVAVPLPSLKKTLEPGELDPLQRMLREKHGFELPVFAGSKPGSRILRISLQAYNDITQIQRLADVLCREFAS